MINIYDKDSTDFSNLGLGTLSPTSCIVKEEENGGYSLEMKHPFDKGGKWKRIEEGRIIVAETPDGRQPFRIFYAEKVMKEYIVKANHIFYDLLDNLVLFCNGGSGNANESLQTLKRNFEYNMPFNFFSDITTKNTRLYISEQNPVFCLLGNTDEEGQATFLQAFGGEIKRDRFNVSMLAARGRDRGVIIAYKKNLTGLKVAEDHSEVATRVYPRDRDGNRMSGLFVDSPRIHDYAHPKIRFLDVDNIEDDSEEGTRPPTDEEMKKAAKDFFSGGGDLPKINIKVDFIELSKTEEYKDFKSLQCVYMGDIVTVINKKMNFVKKAKVISYTYDSLLKKYVKIELGDFLPTIYKPISSGAISGGVAASAKNQSSSLAMLLQSHLQDFNNPHKVTAEQTGGGGTVDLTEVNNKIATNTKALAENKKAIDDHLKDFNNPHKVTIDLSKLENEISEFKKKPTILSGMTVPNNSVGRDGDLFIMVRSEKANLIYFKNNGEWKR